MSLQQDLFECIVQNIGLILTFGVSCWFIFVYLPKKPKSFPPGPRGLPILGVALSIGKRPEKTFMAWSKKYGDVIGFKVGNDYTVVLNSYEVINEAYVKYSSAFSHRPNNFLFTEGLRKSGISGSDYSPEYATHRKFAHGILGRLVFNNPMVEAPIRDEADRLISLLGSDKIELNDDTKKKFQFVSGNLVARVAFGKPFSDIKSHEFETIRNAWINFFVTGAPAFNAALISRWLLYLPGIRQSANAVKNAMDEQMELITRIVEEHKSSLDENNPRDFIDEFLVEQKKNKAENLFNDTVTACMTRDLFGGGLETTEVTLIFSCLVLANRPHILKKIQNEIDTVLGPDGKVNYSDRDNLPYCHASIKEMMRFRSVAPLLVPHAVQENINFKGYEIPKGSTILANVHAVHFNPKNFDDPDEFKPERFIKENGEVELSKYLLPFGVGPRMCIGRRLAEAEVFIFFVTLFQHYDVVPTPQPGCERPRVADEAMRTGLTVNPPSNTPVTLIPRHVTQI